MWGFAGYVLLLVLMGLPLLEKMPRRFLPVFRHCCAACMQREDEG